jgi:hypothetical protein
MQTNVQSKNVVNSPKARNIIIAIAIKPSPEPIRIEKDGKEDFSYRMCFVNSSGKKTYVACTKSVWLQVRTHNFTFDHFHNFKLRWEPRENGVPTFKEAVVTSIDRFPKPEVNPMHFELEQGENADKIVALVGRDGEVSVKSSPPALPPGVVDAIVDLLQQAPDSDADELLGDRFMIESSVKRGGQRTLIINPTAM